jgi:hypothetical protein
VFLAANGGAIVRKFGVSISILAATITASTGTAAVRAALMSPMELAKLEGGLRGQLQVCDFSPGQLEYALALSERAVRMMTLQYGDTPEVLQREIDAGQAAVKEFAAKNPIEELCTMTAKTCSLLALSSRDQALSEILGVPGSSPADWPKSGDVNCGDEPAQKPPQSKDVTAQDH